jgi:hypothetical protein
LIVAFGLSLFGCAPRQAPEPPPPVVEPVPQVAPAPQREEAPGARLDRFCQAMQRVVDDHVTGFSRLRDGVVGQRAWSGAVVPAGLTTCTVEGDSPTGARYVCTGPRMPRGNGPLLQQEFRLIAADIDACLARGVWFPRNWQRGQVIDFAGVEQQQTWRDIAPAPRPLVSLNIEDDFLNRLYVIRLYVSTLQ